MHIIFICEFKGLALLKTGEMVGEGSRLALVKRLTI
jgi:hypothetical protein